MPIHTTVKAILDQYDRQHGVSHRFLGKSRSPIMTAVANWISPSAPEAKLRDIILSGYRDYMLLGNFQKGRRRQGVDSTMHALFELDAKICHGKVFNDCLRTGRRKEMVWSGAGPKEIAKTLTARLAMNGLCRFIPDEIFRHIDPDEFSIRDEWGNTPFMWSIANGNITDATFLAKTLPESVLVTPDKYSKSPLIFMAAKGGQYQASWMTRFEVNGFQDRYIKDVVAALLSRDEIDISVLDYQDKRGNTALHLAYLRRDKYMIDALIAKGASETTRNRQGYTPYQLYLKKTPKEAFEYLVYEYMLHEKSLLLRVPDVKMENRLNQELKEVTLSV